MLLSSQEVKETFTFSIRYSLVHQKTFSVSVTHALLSAMSHLYISCALPRVSSSVGNVILIHFFKLLVVEAIVNLVWYYPDT